MRILIAYVSVVLLWSVTPLAIKWSGEGPGYLLGVTGRMVTGLVALLLYLGLSRTPIPLDRRAVQTYLGGALQIFGSMILTYWSSQHLPSGWMAVIFGLTPLMTAPLAAGLLGEKSLTQLRLLSYVVGLSGLAVMFHSALHFSTAASSGIVGILIASFFQSLSAVCIKRIDRGLPSLVLVAGSLLIAVPLYLLTYMANGGGWPTNLPVRALYSILFLGLVATTFGFALYFYVLKNLPAGRVSLITLLTPMMSLYVGDLVNHEPIASSVFAGTFLILSALVLYEWDGLKQLLRPRSDLKEKKKRARRGPRSKLRRRR